MKTVRKKVLFIVTLLSLLSTQLMAENIKGIIRDKSSKEPLTGATVQIVGTNIGVIADLDGNYMLALNRVHPTLFYEPYPFFLRLNKNFYP